MFAQGTIFWWLQCWMEQQSWMELFCWLLQMRLAHSLRLQSILPLLRSWNCSTWSSCKTRLILSGAILQYCQSWFDAFTLVEVISGYCQISTNLVMSKVINRIICCHLQSSKGPSFNRILAIVHYNLHSWVSMKSSLLPVWQYKQPELA